MLLKTYQQAYTAENVRQKNLTSPFCACSKRSSSCRHFKVTSHV